MKKIMTMLALVITITASAFAGEENVKQEVLKAFQTEFTNAQDVTWSTGENYFKASFTLNSQHMFAYYNLDGKLLGVSRYISSLQLPMSLQTELKKGYGDKWITDLFEVANSEGTQYYVTLESADTRVVLKSVNGGSWNLHKKINKA